MPTAPLPCGRLPVQRLQDNCYRKFVSNIHADIGTGSGACGPEFRDPDPDAARNLSAYGDALP